MIFTKKNDIIYFITDGISNHSFTHLCEVYKRIIKRSGVILLSLNENLDEDDENLIKNSEIPLSITKVSEIDLNLTESSFIFPNASSLPTENKDFIKSKTGCFIGGVNSKDTIQKQINSATLLDVDFLFSDLLPTEVSNFINSEELTFFCKRINFIQPYFNKSNQLHNDTNEKFLFLHQTDDKEPQRGNKSIIYKALSKAEHCRVVNLDSLEVKNWFTDAIPGKTCRKVITDAIDPIFYNYLFDLCSRERIELINTLGASTTSPERLFIYESDTASNWFDYAASTSSLRSLVMDILNEKVADEETKDIPPRNNSIYCSDLEVISNFVSDRNESKDLTKETSGNTAKNNFHDTFSNDLFITAINHNSNTIKDESWKLTLDAINHLIHVDDVEKIPKSVIRTLFCKAFSKIYENEITPLGYIFLFKLFNISNEYFLQSISHFLSYNQFKSSQVVLSSVQYLLQNYESDKSSRKVASRQLIAIIDSIQNKSGGGGNEALAKVSARLLLSVHDLTHYEDFALKCIKTKGAIGDSVYCKLMEDLNVTVEELEYFQNMCKSEKNSGLETITTQQSVCIIKIMKGETEGILDSIFNPENPSTNFTKLTWFMFQLSLISLSSKQKDIAQSIISKISLSKIKHSNYNIISFVAVKILLGDHDKFDDENLPFDISYDCIPSTLQSERLIQPYFLFFFLEVIFIASSNTKGVEFTNYHRSMLPYVNKSYFDKILESVPSIGSNSSFLESYSKHLYENLPSKESSIIQLFNYV